MVYLQGAACQMLIRPICSSVAMDTLADIARERHEGSLSESEIQALERRHLPYALLQYINQCLVSYQHLPSTLPAYVIDPGVRSYQNGKYRGERSDNIKALNQSFWLFQGLFGAIA